MTLWRLELLRLLRTSRWLVLLGVHTFFGAVGPVTARYLDVILERFATEEITVTIGDPRPVDGIVQFVSNVSQIGLLAVIIVAAAALAVDARPELSAFLRTRVAHPWQLVLPRHVVVTLASIVSLIVGTALAAGLTTSLIGGLPLGALVIGTVHGSLYLTFAIAVVAAVAGFARTQLAVVFGTVLVLLGLPLLGLIGPVAPWLPSMLLTAVVGLIEGVAATEYLRAAAVSIVATLVLLALATHRIGAREL